MIQPHQQRVIDERDELDTKIESLSTFIQTNIIYNNLPIDERQRLTRQVVLMRKYSQVLSERIASF